MKHIEPPDNLPVVPDDRSEEPATEKYAPPKDVHFRDPEAGDTLASAPADDAMKGAPAPASRSLQPTNSDMTQRKERPIRAPDDLLSVDDVAERLLISRAAVYRLTAHRRVPFYRLPGGMRFKVAEIDAYLESRRTEAQPTKRYGSPKDQG